MSSIGSMTDYILSKKEGLNRAEVQNQIRDAVIFVTDSLHCNFHANMSGVDFCNIFEKWSKTAPQVKMECGFTLSMSEYFAYAFRVKES